MGFPLEKTAPAAAETPPTKANSVAKDGSLPKGAADNSHSFSYYFSTLRTTSWLPKQHISHLESFIMLDDSY